jgi:hypothetical protein
MKICLLTSAPNLTAHLVSSQSQFKCTPGNLPLPNISLKKLPQEKHANVSGTSDVDIKALNPNHFDGGGVDVAVDVVDRTSFVVVAGVNGSDCWHYSKLCSVLHPW